ncbi:hypothetical protein SAMN04244560_02766 [Thermoanaerobacter thermohydrosulfuricus]|uniref:Uncharacterized protein n=2 Tax=Thermoanaerobacter thermohydrosulfuricus TaxID=1516 RepID=M8CX39_THETY|nr:MULTISPECIES: hypothetical protein [Thermoanaerobacter]EMT38938.1 hypothetical protein TthWC1_1541 [Thermoanaerobacter thermohydrosulfuricus WC1]SDG68778.1 hypothetical protein SAMN04244560_02766 [Thermoanaerobacter thermohydrosulfuricus]SFE78633.1 hypothetical protein SAMN04324257_02832 [Thermoanaerobacter thermohydrosulfuricus]
MTEEENFSQKAVANMLEEVSVFMFQDERLRRLRIPGDMLIGMNFEEQEEVKEKINDLISQIDDQILIENYLLEISYALQNYEFTEREIKNLFHLIGLAISDEYKSLLRVIVVKCFAAI